MRARIRIYEVEHYGDVSAAIGDLRRVGVTTIEAGAVDEDEESVTLVVEAPVVTLAELHDLLNRSHVITY